jgi:collagen type I/II/III/V/XI/XXIV/XXVII alpha
MPGTTFNEDGEIDSYTISTTGTYEITAIGATGGGLGPGYLGGAGAEETADFTLTAGTVIEILVGGAGVTEGDAAGGGGGGSFVYDETTGTLLEAAGGGGGASAGSGGSGSAGGPGGEGVATEDGTPGDGYLNGFGYFPGGAGGTGGAGGGVGALNGTAGAGSGGGGGGFSGDGANGANGDGGASFLSGGDGGISTDGNSPSGGFGGGGGASANSIGGGGGGGYSGGGGGEFDYAGGGGSYIAADATNASGISGENASGNGSVVITEMPCFAAGTCILTAHGELPVEGLQIGDLVATRTGLRPIKWIGTRAYDPRFIRGQKSVLPIVISAGALAHGVPARDLWVSPEHALYLDDVLVPAKLLVNGMTIVQVEAVDQLEYFHIELDSHDVILAEGTPAETYIECNNRRIFHNAAEFTELYPEAPVAEPVAFCAPRLEEGAAVLAIRERLLARATALGYQVTDDPGLHLVADGLAIEPLAIEGEVYRFVLDTAPAEVWLASRSTVPAEIDATARDRRRLGVCLRRIALRDVDLTLDLVPDHHLLQDGFYGSEGAHRWTDGMAQLPGRALALFAGPLAIEVTLWPSQLRYAEPTALLPSEALNPVPFFQQFAMPSRSLSATG